MEKFKKNILHTLSGSLVIPIISHNMINSRFLGKIALEQSNIHEELKWDGFVKQTGANRCLSWGMILLLLHNRFESCLFPAAEFDCRESSWFNHRSLSLALLIVSLTCAVRQRRAHVWPSNPSGHDQRVSPLTPHGNVMLIGNQVWLVFCGSAHFQVTEVGITFHVRATFCSGAVKKWTKGYQEEQCCSQIIR